MKKLSVILPVYNCEKTVEAAIFSVLNQEINSLDFIIIDDGSRDNTPKIIYKYRKSARIIRQKNQGVSVARNQGIRIAKNPFIAFIDSDDQWLPGKISHQMELFERFPSVSLTTTGSCFYSKDGRITRIENREFHGKLITQLSKGDYINTSAVIVKRKALRPFKEPFPKNIHYAEDYVLWVRLALTNEFHASPNILVKTRASNGAEFLSKYSEKDIRNAYQLIIDTVQGHCKTEDLHRFKSRLHFELASLFARRKDLRRLMSETMSGILENPLDIGNASWCLKNYLRYFEFL